MNAADRVHRLETAVGLARDRVDEDALAAADDVIRRSRERLERGPDHVVVAVAGGTGSGKSSLSNALARQEMSQVSPVRPTTERALLWSVGAPDHGLLEWLAIEDRRVIAPADDLPEGLVVIDLPDHDSLRTSHRAVVDRVVGVVDVLVVVVDPLKYAQQALFSGYLAPLAHHADVLVVVLNRVDELDDDDERRCTDDLRRLLDETGLSRSRLLTTSAATGRGVDELRDLLAEETRSRRAVGDRIAADVEVAASALVAGVSAVGRPGDTAPLVRAMGEAADLSGSVAAAAATYRERGRQATRPPLTGLVARAGGRLGRTLRPAPAVRLARRLGAGDDGGGSAATVADRADRHATARAASHVAVRHALEGVVQPVRAGLPRRWATRVTDAAEDLAARLPRRTAEALELVALRTPRRLWWSVLRVWWTLVELAVITGVLWLTALFAVAWLRLPEPPTPQVGVVDVPTLLVVAGIPVWLLTRLLRGVAIRRGSRRHGQRARRRLTAQVEAAVDTALQDLHAEVDARDELLDTVAAVTDRRRAGRADRGRGETARSGAGRGRAGRGQAGRGQGGGGRGETTGRRQLDRTP